MADDVEETVPESDVPNGTPMFQISQSDLEELERIIPEWCWKFMMKELDSPRGRSQFERVKRILSDVRWHYGPWTGVTIIPAGPDDDSGPQ